jgi:2'-5' RNA ligase
MERIRSFIAVTPSEDVLSALQRAQTWLQDEAGAKACRWMRPESIHLTLKFLGDVPVENIDAIAQSLRETCQTHESFQLVLSGVGCFPNLRRPRVVWIGVEGDTEALGRLQADVEAAMEALGFPPEKRAFHPHLTIARVRRRARRSDVGALGRTIEGARTNLGISFTVDRLALIKSDLRPLGAVYTKLTEGTLR